MIPIHAHFNGEGKGGGEEGSAHITYPISEREEVQAALKLLWSIN